MAAPPSQQPQFTTSGGSRTHPNELLSENIEYDQIVVPDKEGWKNLLQYTGPGFLVSMAYIDPGNLQTDLQSGAQYKYGLLWIILLASCAALVIQSLAANLGVVTGKHLAEHCRLEYPKVPNFILWILAEIAVVACDIPEAFALNMLFRIPLWCGVLITGLSTLFLLSPWRLLESNSFNCLLFFLLSRSYICGAFVFTVYNKALAGSSSPQEACRFYLIESGFALINSRLSHQRIRYLSKWCRLQLVKSDLR